MAIGQNAGTLVNDSSDDLTEDFFFDIRCFHF